MPQPSLNPVDPSPPNQKIGRPFVHIPNALLERCKDPVSRLEIEGAVWEVGSPDPGTRRPSPRFTFAHCRMIALLMSAGLGVHGGSIPFSRADIVKLVRQSGKDPCTREKLACERVLSDLRNTWICRTVVDGDDIDRRHFTILETFVVEEKLKRDVDGEIKLVRRVWKGIRFTPEFHAFLRFAGDAKQTFGVDVASLLSIRSELAAKIYCVIAGPASHRDGRNPFRIDLSTLCARIGRDSRQRSKRREDFIRNDGAVLKAVDGQAVRGGTLRVELAENAAGTDDQLRAWSVKSAEASAAKPALSPSKFKRAFLEGGRSETDFNLVLSRGVPLSDYDLERLSEARVSIETVKQALTLAKALLPEGVWDGLVSEIKGDVREAALNPGRSVDNPTGLLLSRLLDAVRSC